MHDSSLAVGRNQRFCPVAACAPLVLVVAGLTAAPALRADGQPDVDPFNSAPSAPVTRDRAALDGEFAPLTKVVPRAKIVLKERERLPDLGGEKTFAAYGSRKVEPGWYADESIVPMYLFAYHPIYMEDMNLERCGLSCGCCLQPAVSGLHFFGSIALLPYKMLVSPPCSYVYPPGECEPGCRFSYCENFIGPKPDISRLFDCRILNRCRQECQP